MTRSRASLTAVFLAAILTVTAGPSAAQLATITFPDTAVGSTATVKCPTNTVSLCFGNPPCSGSGTVQSVTGPNAPFSINKFNLLSNAEFSAGNCEAHPVSLPVNVGAGQILAYQATFAPTAGGTFNGTLTFTTSGGPATVNLTGKGIAGRSDRGGVLLLVNGDNFVPGSTLDLRYQTTPGTLAGNVDLYFIVAFPSGQQLFVTESGGVTPDVAPFRRNVTVTDATQSLFSDRVPVGAQFGTYTFYMVMAYAGSNAVDPHNWASPVTSVTVTYAALSSAQLSIKQSRGGNPDLLAVTWVGEQTDKRETWIYFSGTPTIYRFLNGSLQSQSPAAGVPTGPTPKVDPALYNPQTTLAQLTAALGPPSSVTVLDGVPALQVVQYGFGLSVVLRDGVLSSASTSVP